MWANSGRSRPVTTVLEIQRHVTQYLNIFTTEQHSAERSTTAAKEDNNFAISRRDSKWRHDTVHTEGDSILVPGGTVFLSSLIKELLRVMALKARSSNTLIRQKAGNPIVSLTSFPARIDHVWIPIECIFQQTLRPAEIFLILSIEEFPDKQLPRSLQQQQKRGLEILWVEKNIRSYKKLLPVKKLFPDRDIVTIDDDKFYDPNLLTTLVSAAGSNPHHIIGTRGWEVGVQDTGLIPYRQWKKADVSTPRERTFLTGVGGIYYPADTPFCEMLFNEQLALELCPRGDDIWFWGMARLSKIPTICLGKNVTRPIKRLKHGPSLWRENCNEGGNDRQLANLVRRFPNLIENGLMA